MEDYDIEAVFKQGFAPPAKYEIKDKIYVFKEKIFAQANEISKMLLEATDDDREILKNQYDQVA